MVEFLGRHWHLSITRNLSFFQACFDAVGQIRYAEKFGAAPIEEAYVVKDGRHTSIFHNEENMKTVYARMEEICSSPRKLRRLEKAYGASGTALLRASDRLEKNPDAAAFKAFVPVAQRLAAGLSLTTIIGRCMPEILTARLKAAFPGKNQSELDAIVGEVTYPAKHTPLVESQLSLLAIGAELQKKQAAAREVKKYPAVYRRFRTHVRKYSVIPVNFNEEPWSEEDIIGQLGDVMKKDCATEIRSISKRHEAKVKRASELLKKMDSETRVVARSLQAGTLLNEYRKFVFCRASLAYRPLFKKIAEQHGLGDWRELWKLTPDEVFELGFRRNKKILRFLPQRRVAGLVFADNTNGYRAFSKKEIGIFLPETEVRAKPEEKQGAATEVRGMVGNPGFVRAPARIILSRSDFHKFRDGDVIVAPMTSVDYVPLMERASAFVTNEGGITSHASIVSRELGKPCVIGTKTATKVFADGDVLEVDATKGVVRKVGK